NAQACSSPRSSEASASRDIAGLQNVPNATPAEMTTRAITKRFSGQGSTHRTAVEPTRPYLIGSSRPRRPETRPTPSESEASSAPAQRKVAPIATAPKPSDDSRSGASTASDPNRRPGKVTNQTPARMRGDSRARKSAETGCGSAGRVDGIDAAHAVSPIASSA